MAREADVSRQEHEHAPTSEGPAAIEPEPLTAVAEPVVIDLREGVDTIAAFAADAARRARPAEQVETP
jgi:hypothetical protein